MRRRRGLVLDISVASAFGLLVGLAIGLSAYGQALARGHAPGARLEELSLVLGAGTALAAFYVKLVLDTFVVRRALWRFLIMLAGLAVAIPIGAGGIFALVYRSHFAPLHEPLLSVTGLHQLVWSVLAGLYTFFLSGPHYVSLWSAAAIVAAAASHAAELALSGRARSARAPTSPERRA